MDTLTINLVEKTYLWDIESESGDTYTAETLHDPETLTFSTSIWNDDGKLLKDSNPIYIQVLEQIESKLD
jgi:hypothetical protein